MSFLFCFVLFSSYELIRTPDGVWGTELPDGSWNGLIGLAHRKVGTPVTKGWYV